eukprot:CAMPEP_0176329198 /NCGR_PEP_ID=MMETSP0121_2-20121125/75354_1 /TAXON_ID=160619 /ORGANISM="Kryptoperidinium foliaceum, Strain CCMP 1326" /LENGTH=34 /DNA_ID= /DNA_START= /DNA_END= /DNA_ORIENTATION=
MPNALLMRSRFPLPGRLTLHGRFHVASRMLLGSG